MDPDWLVISNYPQDISLEYLAEGAANIVYRINIPPPSPSIAADISLEDYTRSSTPPPSEVSPLHYDPVFNGRLLRLRKTLRSASPNAETAEKLHSVITALFDSNSLIAYDLVRLPNDLIRTLNEELKKSEANHTRPKKRHGLYLSEDEPFGTLITDMTANEQDGEILIEFKPKWLSQSPSAPKDARRCRTCALRAQRDSLSTLPKDEGKKDFCPLDLMSKDSSRLQHVVEIILPSRKYPLDDLEYLRKRFTEFLLQNTLLARLRDLQQQLDSNGPLNADLTSQSFLTAMTIRDCTMFVKIPRDEDRLIETRLGDLDFKNPGGGKAEYWKSLEVQLIEGGWYTCTEPDASSEGICFLAST